MKDLTPQLIDSLKHYSLKDLTKDLTAGVIVAIIALPLSIALALASGVPPEQGLYTAIVAGFVISALGGSKVQIAGPTAAFATIVAGIVSRSGMEGLAAATILAGLILIAMGLLRMGSLIKFIPYTITTGFTAGIAVTILIGQLKDFFGPGHPDPLAQGVQEDPGVPHRRGGHVGGGGAPPPAGEHHRRPLYHLQRPAEVRFPRPVL